MRMQGLHFCILRTRVSTRFGISTVILIIGMSSLAVHATGFELIGFGVFIVLVVEIAPITPLVGPTFLCCRGGTKHEIIYVARTAMSLFT